MTAPRHIILVDGLGRERQPNTTTLHEFLSKPERAVTRSELAAFLEAVILNDITLLIRKAVAHNNKLVEENPHLRGMIASMVMAREDLLRERKWYRRLWRRVMWRGRRAAAPPRAQPIPPVEQAIREGLTEAQTP